MMGIKPRCFQPIERQTLDDLVPVDHFYRQLDRALDLSFVRDFVAAWDKVMNLDRFDRSV